MFLKFQTLLSISKTTKHLRFLSVSGSNNVIYRAKKPRIDVEGISCMEMVLQRVWETSINFPGRYAFIDAVNPQIKRTYQDVYFHSYSLTTFLKDEFNFRKGQVACFFMPNSVDYASVALGTALAGGVISLASNLSSSKDLAKQLNDSGSTVVFCTETNLDTAIEAKKLAPKVKEIITVGPLLSESTSRKSVIYNDITKIQSKFEETHISSDEDLLCLPYSSGTTGLPKGVMLTNKNLVAVLHNYADMMKENIYSTLVPPFLPCEQNSILFLPFYHMFGFGTLLNGMYNRETIVVMTKFDLEKFCKYIQDYKIRIAFVTPPVLVYLAKNPIIDKYDLSSLEIVLSAAAPLGKDLYNEVKKRLPTLKHVFQGYGMTETSFFTTLGSIKTPVGSVGALVNGHELKVVDPETGESLGTNKKGELWYRSNQVMKGYLNRPKETVATIDSDGWLHSGDVGFIDDNGHVYIVDRLKELIKVKGYQVPPTELEDLLLTHPKVKDCAVVGIPCEIRGEIPKAFIVKKCDTLREDEIHDFVNEKVTRYKQLKGGVSFISEIPKSPSGKILRKMLR